MGRRLALLIATFDYQDSALRQLTAPAHDAEALAAVLKDPDIAGFEVTPLINQPHYVVGKAIGDFYRNARRDDLTLLYFTGHGLKDDDGLLYLAMADTYRADLLFTALAAERISQAMKGCNARRKVLILDCCYSGAFPAGRISKSDSAVHTAERFRGRGHIVLTASDATQYSFEGNQVHGAAVQSVFTRYLVDGLRDGSADLDGDGDITLDELYGYVYERVVDEMPQQRPKLQGDVEGRIVIARNINWALPPYLSNDLASPNADDRLTALEELARLHRKGNDAVRNSVIEEIQRLTDDDSKRVSSAATARLRSLLPLTQTSSPGAPPPPSPEAAPEQPPPPRPASPTPEETDRPLTSLAELHLRIDERRDFLVSYTAADRRWAVWISWQLEKAGYSVLVQEWDFVPGTNWLFGMDGGVTQCERTIAVLSPAYLDSVYGRLEWQAVQNGDPAGLLRNLVPVMVDRCAPQGLLGSVVYIDLSSPELGVEAAQERLLAGVGGARTGRSKPTVAPPFPRSEGPL